MLQNSESDRVVIVILKPIEQLFSYHCEKKLHFYEMMILSALY